MILDEQPFSSPVAELVTGEHTFKPGMSLNGKAHALASLLTLYHSLVGDDSIGWIEHTSDWDWYVQVQKTDGTIVGDGYIGETGEPYDWESNLLEDRWSTDTLTYPHQRALSFEVDDRHYEGSCLRIDFFTDDRPVLVRLEDIQSITIGQR